MKRFAVALTGVAILLLIVSVAYSWPVPVPNPSFEEADPAKPEQPMGYSTYASPGTTAEFKWDRAVAHSGRASLYISNRGPVTALWSISPNVACTPGVRYRISVWVKTREATGFTGLVVRYRNKDNSWAALPMQSSEGVKGTTDWQQINFTIEPPPAAEGLVIFMSNTRSEGAEAWFDDLAVEDMLGVVIQEGLPGMIAQLARFLSEEGDRHLLPKQPGKMSQSPRLARASLQAWQDRAEALLKRVQSFDQTTPAAEERARMAQEWAALTREFAGLERDVALAASVGEWMQRRSEKSPPYIAGWQNSLTRVWLRDRPAKFQVSETGHLDAIKGETEAIQLVIAPIAAPLSQVKISVGDLAGPAGRIPASQVSVNPIGFVHIEKPDVGAVFPVEAVYSGWWPEILLEPFAFDVERGDTQPVWISVSVPRETPPGTYTVPVTITPANAPPLNLSLEVKVWDCELPRTWHFRNILSFHDGWAKKFYEGKWTPELREKFLDLLVARRINLTSMYGDTDFTWDEIMKAVAAGQNTILVYTIPSNAGLKDPPTQAPWIAPATLAGACKTLDVWVPKLKEAGLFDRALFYGFDEVAQPWFEAARRAFPIIKERYSNIQTISTLYDASYGLNTGLTGVVDNFMPSMIVYDADQARKARQRGTKVWWYETSWNVEHRLTRSRLIPWMTFKVEADGFLVWCMNRWVGGEKPGLPKAQWQWNTQPVANKILNEWNPWLDGVCPNSSANYIYPGANGPLSCTRLECFRDGIEDYDLLCEARERLRALKEKGGDAAAIQGLEKALTIEDAFIKDCRSADYRPEALLEHRLRLIEAMSQTR